MRRNGQAVIIVALAAGVLILFLILTIDTGVYLHARSLLSEAVENAAVAALRPSAAGQIVTANGETWARRVLSVELENLKWLRGDPEQYAQSASIELFQPGNDGCAWVDGICHPGLTARVSVEVEIALPLYWSSVRLAKTVVADLTENPDRNGPIPPAPDATQIPTSTPVTVPISPTPTSPGPGPSPIPTRPGPSPTPTHPIPTIPPRATPTWPKPTVPLPSLTPPYPKPTPPTPPTFPPPPRP